MSGIVLPNGQQRGKAQLLEHRVYIPGQPEVEPMRVMRPIGEVDETNMRLDATMLISFTMLQQLTVLAQIIDQRLANIERLLSQPQSTHRPDGGKIHAVPRR